MFEYTFAEVSQQSDAQPLLLSLWLNWLTAVNLLSVLFVLRRVQARWVLGAYVVMIALNIPLALMFGFGKALAIPHLLVWVPLIYYLAQEWRYQRLQDSAIFKTWIAAVMATNLISVVFDLRDAAQFLAGDTAPIKADMADVPYITFAAIIASLIALFVYLRRSPSPAA